MTPPDPSKLDAKITPLSANAAPTTVPPAAPAPVEPPPLAPPTATPPPAAQDPFLKHLLESTGKVLGLDGKPEDAPKPAPVEPPKMVFKSTMTLGEMAAERARKLKEAADNPEQPPATPPTSTAPAPIPPSNEPVAPSITPPAVVPPAPRLQRKVAPLAVPPPAPIPVPVVQQSAPVVVPPVDPDAAIIATLDDDAKSEVELAAFAEANFPELKGKRTETLNYFKKINDFAATNPTSEDLDAFINSNKPKWSPAQKRKVELQQVKAEAVAQATQAVRAELQPKLAAAENRIRQQELNPVIDRQMADLSSAMTSVDILPDATMEAIPSDVAKRIEEVGYEAASREFKVEAPIFQGAQNAARSYLRMVNGVEARNHADPVQNFVVDFVQRQGVAYASKPEPETVVNGKRFLPLHQYNQAVAQNPQNAAAYYTFNDRDVLDLLAINANISYNNELKALENAGFTRPKRSKFSATAPAPTPAPAVSPVVSTPPPPSPKVRNSPPPSPNNDTPKPSQAASFLELVAPGMLSKNIIP